MRVAVDPFTLEVIRNMLSAIAEEMSLVVMRAARSPLLREAGDLSSALTDASGELTAQGRDIPMHMGVMSFTVKEFLKRLPAQRLAPGDLWFFNLPEVGGNHLPDVKAIRPVFVEGRIAAYAVSLAHWADIGGAVPGSYVPWATDAWQEGLRISPLRLFSAAGPDQEKLDLVLANLRGAEERRGDILAQMAATGAAEQRLHELFARHGATTLENAIGLLHDRAETQMRAALARLPRGTYEGEDWLGDDDGAGGAPLPNRVRIELAGENGATFDFSGSGDAARGPLNTTPFIAAASVFYAIKALVGPEIQANGGCYRPLSVVTRPGSVLDPGPGRPVVGGNHETSQRLVDAIFKALEPAVPELLSAGGPTTSGLLLCAGSRDDSQWTTLYETHGGGAGANLVLTARDTAALDQVAAEARALGRRAEVVAADVTDDAQVAAMAEKAEAFFDGRIDILVNVAGVTGPIETPAWEIAAEDFSYVIESNIKGSFLPIKHVIPAMIACESGKIVNIGGTSGTRGYKYRAAYSSSKWGVRGLTRTVALDAGEYGINVNVVMPGIVETPRMQKLCEEKARLRGWTKEQVYREYVEDMALKSVTTPQDVANAVLFLASDEGRNITGQELTVDGGWDV